MSSTNEKAQVAQKSEIEVLREKLAKKEAEMQAQKEALKAKMSELREQAKALKEEERKAKAELKTQEAKERAKKLAKALKSQGQGAKRNLTEEVRQAMLAGKTIDQMVEELGVERKAILDRRWLIEKKAGLR
jgi:septal ring factor EnvC (AmiA/AmiB activator)